ncbi:hypothetical protein AVEN_199498-1 [Araneus ventricosus]|uniref:Uncharacterized protein n=1 Tax=Araneus ventricosus TaxID=182803 RepID=A0A4Y2X0F6_ARAVE|nr:hypothetical protein AVEN_199498-1 [Araneus ventricosus]
MMKTTPDMVPYSPNFCTTPASEHLTTPTYDLACSRPNTRQIFRVGFEPGALRLCGRHITTRQPRPHLGEITEIHQNLAIEFFDDYTVFSLCTS